MYINFHDFFFFRHERTSHPQLNTADATASAGEDADQDPQDPVYNYHCVRLAYGLFMAEMNDAIREGDGERLVDCYKLALLFFHNYGHPKYAYVVLLHLVKLRAFLSESEAFDLTYNRFHNERGGKGNNIPLDLRKEHDHHVIKPMWKALGSNLNEENAGRIAHSLEGLKGILHSVDSDRGLNERKGYRSSKLPAETVQQIVNDLNQSGVFSFTGGRDGYPSFENFPSNLLSSLDYRGLHNWMTDKIRLWASIFEDV